MLKNYKRIITDEIIKYLNTDDIIVLHGARQVGKTFILYWLENYLKQEKEITHYIDLEDSRFVNILNLGANDFIRYLEEEGFNVKKFSQNKKLFIFRHCPYIGVIN
ncbi:AAA family ATPase [Patescibacteria group bacterium]|nr:AAA family ATPase [Patescibacteria group bacterium]